MTCAAATVVAAATLLSPGMAFAGGGGGSAGGGSATGDGKYWQGWAYKDSDNGAWGGASLASVKAAVASLNVGWGPAADGVAQQALSEANTNCVARFKESHPGEGDGDCRVVAVGVSAGTASGSPVFYGNVGTASHDIWMENWVKYVQPGTYSNNGASYTTGKYFTDQPDTNVNILADRYAGDAGKATIAVLMLNSYEPVPAEVPPPAPTKTVQKGTSADRMVNHTTISQKSGVGGKKLLMRDTFTPNGQKYEIVNEKITDGGQDVTSQFSIGQSGDVRTASFKGASLPDNHTYVWEFDVVADRPSVSRIGDKASTEWNGKPVGESDSHEFPTWAPNPDKSWVKLGKDGTWQAVIDPSRSNTTGADNSVFLDGDQVGAVVNGTVAANLIQAPQTLTLSDDWGKADYLFDAADVTKVKVYDADASSEAQSSVTDIVNKGRDVTDQFDITLKGTTVTARAKAGYLASVKGLAKPKQLTLLVPGEVNFANGQGAGQVRADFGKQAGDELTFCTNPATVDGGAKLTNAGSQTVNTQTKQTNEPNICGYVPPVKKDVVAEASQGGDQGSVDGKTVFPGQKVEYNLETQPKLPENLAYDVTDVAVTDSYSQYLDVDKQTLEITDLNTGKFIPKTQYTSTWNDKDHTVRLSFASAYVQANWKAGANPRIIVRFEGTVSKDAPADTKVDNQWKLTLNNSITPSNKVVNKPPKDNPSKQDTQKDATINIDGKTAMLGDQIYYRVNIDATNLNDTAYVVQRLGMVDDYDQDYLKLDTKGIQMLDQSGKDVSDKFNFQEKDGVVYAFFKTVDTTIPATGETVKGDPQPADLQEYSLAKLDALKSPAIDQKVLGQSYQVVLPMKVIKVTDGYTVRNTATQITNDEHKVTNTVSNPLKPINPSKDVVVNMGGGSADNQSIYLNSLFLYQLDSSTMPVNRAYQQITDWTITDPYDTAHDRYTGQWAVYATKDVVEYQDGKAVTLAKKGDRIAGKDVDSTKFGGDLFTAANKDGVLTVSATARFLSIASSNNGTEQGWRAYVQMERIATGDVKNQFTETINGQPRPSNPVVTHTPDQTPSISIVKYDAKSGIKTGDRNDPKGALNVTGDTEIVFHITNTGKSDLAKIDLKDATIAGSGQVVDFKYPANWDSLVLKPGESTDVTGTLKGIKANDHHTDRANVTAKPVIECPVIDEDPFDDVPGKQAEGPCYDTQISAHDDWNGYVKPAVSGVLAKTGADVMWLLLAGVLLAGAGAGFVVMRRRRSQAATTSRNTGEDR